MRNFRDLSIWNKSHKLVLHLYQLTATFPASELYGLVSQIRRCSASIPTNIAEGCGHESNKEMKRFLTIAQGSCSELHYLILLSKDLGFIEPGQFNSLEQELIVLKKMMYSFSARINISSGIRTSTATPKPET